MVCSNCGIEVEEAHNFCLKCGKNLKQNISQSSMVNCEIRSTKFKIKNNISGKEEIVEINKDTFHCPILIGSSSECDVILKSDINSEIFGQQALLGHMGHHTYIRTKRDENGKIPVSTDEYGHLTKSEDGDYRNFFGERYRNRALHALSNGTIEIYNFRYIISAFVKPFSACWNASGISPMISKPRFCHKRMAISLDFYNKIKLHCVVANLP